MNDRKINTDRSFPQSLMEKTTLLAKIKGILATQGFPKAALFWSIYPWRIFPLLSQAPRFRHGVNLKSKIQNPKSKI